jgi:hypothetical protein
MGHSRAAQSGVEWVEWRKGMPRGVVGFCVVRGLVEMQMGE